MSLRRSTRVKDAPKVTAVEVSTSSEFKKPPVPKRASSKKANQDEPAAPTTPKNKRRVDSLAKVPPFTPTPSAVGLIAAPHTPGGVDDVATPPAKRARTSRPAQPHMTNALLHTPKGSQILAAIPNGEDTDTSTENLLEKACAHLIKIDPKLKPLIEKNHCRIFSPEGLQEEVDPFKSLTTGIISQQVSGAAARSIKNKFVALFNEGKEEPHDFPKPDVVAATSIERLRTAGLSQRKAEYIQGLAEKFASGEFTARMLAEASDEEIIEKLTAVRGLGKWSVEMFACFALKRMDILSTGDLGVQRGMAAYMGRDVAKLKAKGGKWKYMSEQDMLDISAKFAPYRTLFMWYMWRIEDVDVDAMESA